MKKVFDFTFERFGSHNKETAEGLQERLNELSVLNKLSVALSSGQDLYHLLRLLLDELKELFTIDTFYIGIFDSETSIVNFPIFYEKGEFLDVTSRNLLHKPGLTGAVIFNEKTLYIPDRADPEIQQKYRPHPIGQTLRRSYFGTPLILNRSVIGILSVQAAQPNAYTPQQIQLLETIAAQSAIAVDKARLFYDLQLELEKSKHLIVQLESKNAESETLHESLASIAGTFELSEIITRVLDQIKRVVPYDAASVWHVEGNWQKLIGGRGLPSELDVPDYGYIIDGTSSGMPILKGEVPYILNNHVQKELADFRNPPHDIVNSWLALPLKAKGAIIGIIALDGRRENQFTAHHAELAVAFANQVAIALENAQLFSKLQNELTEHKQSEDALRESELRLRAIIENVPFDMWLCDRNRQYILQSGESMRVAGNIIGKTVEELGVPQDTASQWKSEHDRVMNGETVYREGAWEVNGELRDFITYLAPVKDGGEMFGYVGISLDITKRKQAEQKVRELNAELEQRVKNRTIELQSSEEKARLLATELEAVRQATITLSSQVELSAVLDAILKSTLNLLPSIGDVHLFLIQNDELEFATALWGGGRKSNPISAPRPGGLTDSVMQRGEIILVEDMQHHPLYDTATADWNGAMIGIPLKFGSQLVGVMNVHYAMPRSFSESEIRLLQLFADQAAIAVENARLFQDLQDEKDHLEQHNHQREIMSAMTDLLQASLTTEEAGKIVSSHIKVLFPNLAGALYLTNASNSFEPITLWGELNSLDVFFTTNDCWALRRGKPYRFGSSLPNPPCAHIGKVIPQHAMCIPLSAQGENIGSLHMSTQNGGSEIIREDELKFIETIADSISLALANLRLRERLHFESIRDGLTGLFNRRYLDETLPREIHQAERQNRPISVFMFDIDHFKKFNDTYGHDAGDVVLKNIAGLILSGIREGDIGCRYGGEEFVIILPDTTLEVASRRAENLRKDTSQLVLRHHGQELGKVTISIGVATYPQHGTTRDTLIKSADEASYQAKKGGRNRVVLSQKHEKVS